MSYEKITPDRWLSRLLGGDFESATSAKKSIAKTSWQERFKARARLLADQHFACPGSVKAGDMVKKPNDTFGDFSYQAGFPNQAKILAENASNLTRLANAHHVIRCCKDLFDILLLAQKLEVPITLPTAELERLLINTVDSCVVESDRVLKKQICNTRYRTDLFDKTQPKQPMQLPATS